MAKTSKISSQLLGKTQSCLEHGRKHEKCPRNCPNRLPASNKKRGRKPRNLNSYNVDELLFLMFCVFAKDLIRIHEIEIRYSLI